MYGLPEGWESDYDGSRWFFRYKPTGEIQYHFPQPGDEFAAFVNDAIPFPILTPEERLESDRQIKRRSTTSGEKSGRTTSRQNALRENAATSATLTEVDEGSGSLFSFDSFGYLGPGSYNDVSPLNEEEDGRPDDVPKDRGKKPEGRIAEVANEIPRDQSLSPMTSAGATPAGATPNVASSFAVAAEPVMALPAANETIATPPNLSLDTAGATQNRNMEDSGAVQSPAIPMLHSESRPYELPDEAHMGVTNSHALAQNQQVYTPVGFVAELATEMTAQCREESHPPPIELPSNEPAFGGFQTAFFQAGPVELAHEPIEIRSAPAVEKTEQEHHPWPAPPMIADMGIFRDAQKAPAEDNVEHGVAEQPPRSYKPFRVTGGPEGETAAKRSSLVLGNISVADAQNLEMGLDKKQSFVGPLPEIPAALQPPKVPPKQPLDQFEPGESSTTAPPDTAPRGIPGSVARHDSIPLPPDQAAFQASLDHPSAQLPTSSGLSHVPSILRPARGQPQPPPMQPSIFQPTQRVQMPVKPYMSFHGNLVRSSPTNHMPYATLGQVAMANQATAHARDSLHHNLQPDDADFVPGIQRVNTLPDQLPSHAMFHDPTPRKKPAPQPPITDASQARPSSVLGSYDSSLAAVQMPAETSGFSTSENRAAVQQLNQPTFGVPHSVIGQIHPPESDDKSLTQEKGLPPRTDFPPVIAEVSTVSTQQTAGDTHESAAQDNIHTSTGSTYLKPAQGLDPTSSKSEPSPMATGQEPASSVPLAAPPRSTGPIDSQGAPHEPSTIQQPLMQSSPMQFEVLSSEFVHPSQQPPAAPRHISPPPSKLLTPSPLGDVSTVPPSTAHAPTPPPSNLFTPSPLGDLSALPPVAPAPTPPPLSKDSNTGRRTPSSPLSYGVMVSDPILPPSETEVGVPGKTEIQSSNRVGSPPFLSDVNAPGSLPLPQFQIMHRPSVTEQLPSPASAAKPTSAQEQNALPPQANQQPQSSTKTIPQFQRMRTSEYPIGFQVRSPTIPGNVQTPQPAPIQPLFSGPPLGTMNSSQGVQQQISSSPMPSSIHRPSIPNQPGSAVTQGQHILPQGLARTSTPSQSLHGQSPVTTHGSPAQSTSSQHRLSLAGLPSGMMAQGHATPPPGQHVTPRTSVSGPSGVVAQHHFFFSGSPPAQQSNQYSTQNSAANAGIPPPIPSSGQHQPHGSIYAGAAQHTLAGGPGFGHPVSSMTNPYPGRVQQLQERAPPENPQHLQGQIHTPGQPPHSQTSSGGLVGPSIPSTMVGQGPPVPPVPFDGSQSQTLYPQRSSSFSVLGSVNLGPSQTPAPPTATPLMSGAVQNQTMAQQPMYQQLPIGPGQPHGHGPIPPRQQMPLPSSGQAAMPQQTPQMAPGAPVPNHRWSMAIPPDHTPLMPQTNSTGPQMHISQPQMMQPTLPGVQSPAPGLQSSPLSVHSPHPGMQSPVPSVQAGPIAGQSTTAPQLQQSGMPSQILQPGMPPNSMTVQQNTPQNLAQQQPQVPALQQGGHSGMPGMIQQGISHPPQQVHQYSSSQPPVNYASPPAASSAAQPPSQAYMASLQNNQTIQSGKGFLSKLWKNPATKKTIFAVGGAVVAEGLGVNGAAGAKIGTNIYNTTRPSNAQQQQPQQQQQQPAPQRPPLTSMQTSPPQMQGLPGIAGQSMPAGSHVSVQPQHGHTHLIGIQQMQSHVIQYPQVSFQMAQQQASQGQVQGQTQASRPPLVAAYTAPPGQFQSMPSQNLAAAPLKIPASQSQLPSQGGQRPPYGQGQAPSGQRPPQAQTPLPSKGKVQQEDPHAALGAALVSAFVQPGQSSQQHHQVQQPQVHYHYQQQQQHPMVVNNTYVAADTSASDPSMIPQPLYFNTGVQAQSSYPTVENNQTYVTVDNSQTSYATVDNSQNSYMTVDNTQTSYTAVDNTQSSYMAVDNSQNSYAAVDNSQNSYAVVDNTQNSYTTMGNTEAYVTVDNTQTYDTAETTYDASVDDTVSVDDGTGGWGNAVNYDGDDWGGDDYDFE